MGVPLLNDGVWNRFRATIVLALILIAAAFALAGCGEAASCWNDQRGRATSCDDMRRDQMERNR